MPLALPTSLLCSLVFATACYSGFVDSKEAEHADHSVASIAYDGDELRDVINGSSVTAPTVFRRMGVVFTGGEASGLEFSTSRDGLAWSRWTALDAHHSELENESVFTGDIWASDEDGDQHVRIRALGTTLPSTMTLDFFAQTTGEDVEAGSEMLPTVAAGSTEPIRIGAAQVLPRAAWNARPARCSSGHAPRRLTLHHTEQPNSTNLSAPALVRSVQGYHQNTRGWCDIGYHFLVSDDGRIWQGRPADRIGSHAGGGNNTGNIGIALIGSYTSRKPTEAQLSAVGALIRGLAIEYGISLDRQHLFGHRDMRSTDCPGNAAYGTLDELLARAGGEVDEPPPLPRPDRVRLLGAVYRDGHMSERIPTASVTVDGVAVSVDAFGVYETEVEANATVSIEVSAPGFETTRFSRVAATDPTWGSIGVVAQGSSTGSAGIQGVVYRDGNGQNRVGHAVISLDNGRSAVATPSGYWRISGLAPGTYSVTVSATGFETRTVSRSALSGELSWGSVELTVGSSSGAEPAGPSCADHCGSPDPLFDGRACYCDATCEKAGDCCESYFSQCR